MYRKETDLTKFSYNKYKSKTWPNAWFLKSF